MTTLDATQLYRLPWTLADNGISWLEPTVLCNLQCDGCYRRQEENPHKSWDEVIGELDTFESLRRSDCISIAGGDPLLYPHLVDLVAEIRRRGLKPIINTNGVALTDELLADLERAGVFGFTFHVDSRQGRGGQWQGKTDTELNDLRLKYAEMVARAGNIACSFNATVYAENLHEVPAMLDWAHRHIDMVQTMVFICFRHVVPEMKFDWYAGGQQVPWDRIWYSTEESGREVEIDSRTLIATARDQDPRFQPAAFLNGTHDPQACKWLLTQRAWRTFLGGALRDPRKLFRRVHLQSLMFIQPVDFMDDGEQSMCDGCPDITVHDGKLVWSCRLDELKQYGSFLRTYSRNGDCKAGAEVEA